MASRTRYLVVVVLSVAAAIVSGGCAGNGNETAIDLPAGPITQQRADAYGRSVNLRDSDFSGAVASRNEDQGGETSEPAACAELDGPTANRWVNSESPGFTVAGPTAGQSYGSTITAASTFEETLAINRVFRSEEILPCLQQLFEVWVSESDQPRQYEGLAITRIPGLLPGAPGNFGVRTIGSIVLDGDRVPVFFDIFGFLGDLSEVDLVVVSYPKAPDPFEEERLLKVLYERAGAIDF